MSTSGPNPLPASASDERGVALVITILVVLAISAIATGAAIVGSNHFLVNRFYERESVLVAAADEGLEIGRAHINQDAGLVPDSGYAALIAGQPVVDPVLGTLPGVTRSVYVGRTGVASGQYGSFATILAVVEDDGGGKAIRRSQVFEESFARFAYFSVVEDPTIRFGSGDHILGPLHTNDSLRIWSTGATFHDETRTAELVDDPAYGTFLVGYEENAPVIDLPSTADLAKLKTQATQGGTAFVGDFAGAAGTATTRIDFMAIDLNSDGDSTDANEGFFRVYQSSDGHYVTGKSSATTLANSLNCGYYDGGGTFVPADSIGSGWETALESATRACYLGGADSLFGDFEASTSKGGWVARPGPAIGALSSRPKDKAYLFPLGRDLNPDFKGVIYVDGDVAVSGVVRGRVTVVASGNIFIVDDIRYATDPGLGTCEDVAGLLSPSWIYMADNLKNSPFRPYSGAPYVTYDDTPEEDLHAVVLALESFGAYDYPDGSLDAEPCGTEVTGRGCLNLTGGIIQRKRGAVARDYGSGQHSGYIKRYGYDTCGKTDPPPYFPTTGHFYRGQYYPVDPAGFDVATFFQKMTAS